MTFHITSDRLDRQLFGRPCPLSFGKGVSIEALDGGTIIGCLQRLLFNSEDHQANRLVMLFLPNLRDVEGLLAYRGILISYQTIGEFRRKFAESGSDLLASDKVIQRGLGLVGS